MNNLNLELDNDGCPTDESLEQIKSFKGSHSVLLKEITFLFDKYGKCEAEGNTWRISTGGWSGCESVIRALQKNLLFWSVCWKFSKRGGYYEFETE